MDYRVRQCLDSAACDADGYFHQRHSGGAWPSIAPPLELPKSCPMSAYVIFDVEIFDLPKYQEFMNGVKPALEAAGGKYLARAGEHRVYEGDWQPRRIVILEFPDLAAFEGFYNGPVYRNLKSIRDECSRARLVAVQGL